MLRLWIKVTHPSAAQSGAHRMRPTLQGKRATVRASAPTRIHPARLVGAEI
jgi:hypothetical protein